MPSPQEQDEGLAAATTKTLSALLDTHACSICHDLLSAPVALPCSHVFCSECVRRHLSTKSSCPHPTCRKPTTYMKLNPLRGYDVALEPLRRTMQKIEPIKLGAQNRLVFLSRKACSRAQLMERLRAHDIPTHGGTEAIANRYNDFVIRWNANHDAGVPKSKKSIVAAVMASEKGAGKKSKRPRGVSSFFTRASQTKSQDDVEVPAEGDDFATLVKKTRARMERKRRLTQSSEGNEKRARFAMTGHSSKEDAERRSNVADDGDKDDGIISEPPDRGSLSQPSRTQESLVASPKGAIALLDPDASNSRNNAVSSQSLSICNSVCRLDIEHEAIRKNSPNSLSRPSADASNPQNNAASSRCLSICRNVCCLDMEHEATKNITTGGMSQPSVEGLRQSGQNVAIMPLRAEWSQTTPEKQVVRIAAGEPPAVAISDGQSSVKPRSVTGAVVHVAAVSTTPHSNPNEKSTTPESCPSVVVIKRPRTPGSFGSPLANEKGQNIRPQGPNSNLQRRKDKMQKSNYPSKLDPSFGSTVVRGSPSGAAVPTEAQLARAEQNRLAALERRRKFYERRALSQMRQPEL